MKKVMFVLAVAGMFAFAACNNNAEEAPVDTMAQDMEQVQEPAEDIVDSAIDAVENAAEAVDAAAENVQ